MNTEENELPKIATGARTPPTPDDGEIKEEINMIVGAEDISDHEDEEETTKIVKPKEEPAQEDAGLENIISDEGELCDSDGKNEEKEKRSTREKSKKKDKDRKKHKSSKHKKKSRSRSPKHHRRSPSTNANDRQLSPIRNSSKEVQSSGRRYQTDKKRNDGAPRDLFNNPIILHNRCAQVIQIGENQATLITDEDLRTFIKESLKLGKSMERIIKKREELTENMNEILKGELKQIRKIHAELPRHMQNVLKFEGNSVYISQGGAAQSGFPPMGPPPFSMPPFMPPPGMFPMPPPGFPMMNTAPPQLPPIPSLSQLTAMNPAAPVPPAMNTPATQTTLGANREVSKPTNDPTDWRTSQSTTFHDSNRNANPKKGRGTPVQRSSESSMNVPPFSQLPPHLSQHMSKDNRRFGSPSGNEVKEKTGKVTPPLPVQLNPMAFNNPPMLQGNRMPDFSRMPPQSSSQELSHSEGPKTPEGPKSLMSTTFRSNPTLHNKDGSMLPANDISKNLSNFLTSALKAHVSQVKTTTSPFGGSPANLAPSRDKSTMPSLMSVNTSQAATSFLANRGNNMNPNNRKRQFEYSDDE